MNALNLDFQKHNTDIINALAEVYGEEHIETISERYYAVKRAMYNNIEGVEYYYEFLITCKCRELSVKFLVKAGIDIGESTKKSYAEYLDEDVEKMISNFIGSPWAFKADYNSFSERICSFQQQNDEAEEKIIEEQIAFLNFLIKENKVTNENFEMFKKTAQYEEALTKINNYLIIYDELKKEMEKYYQEIKPYNDFVIAEKKRREATFDRKEEELFEAVEEKLTPGIRKAINRKRITLRGKSQILFKGIDFKSNIEYFSQEDETKINDPLFNETRKEIILCYRLLYFNSMGIDVDPWEDRDKYYELIQRTDFKSIMPSKKLVKEIINIRSEKVEECQEEYIYNSETFVKNMVNFIDNGCNRHILYRGMQNRMICITCGTPFNAYNHVFFYTIEVDTGGMLDYIYLHELVHAIEMVREQGYSFRAGFDVLQVGDGYFNIHNPRLRKYERFNETLTDILAIETRDILHKKDIYFAEPKENIINDVSNNNTSNLLKDLVKPLILMVRPQIIKMRLYGDIKEFCDLIGEENYEALNDSINIVDRLIDQGLFNKLEENEKDDPLVTDYNAQLLRVEQIYLNIGNKISMNTEISPSSKK